MDCTLSIIQHNGLSIIDQLPSSDLRELYITFQLTDGDIIRDDCSSKLSAIDTLLKSPNFSHLEGFNIGMSSISDSMRNYFPHSTERDLLHLITTGEVKELRELRDTQVMLFVR